MSWQERVLALTATCELQSSDVLLTSNAGACMQCCLAAHVSLQQATRNGVTRSPNSLQWLAARKGAGVSGLVFHGFNVCCLFLALNVGVFTVSVCSRQGSGVMFPDRQLAQAIHGILADECLQFQP